MFLAALAGMTYLPDLYTEAETRTFVRDVLLPNNEVWVAVTGGRVIGFAGLGEDVLRHLWVEPEAQNRGVGTALLALASWGPTSLRRMPATRRRRGRSSTWHPSRRSSS